MLLSADKIHDGKKWLPPGTVLEVTADGTIAGIIDLADVRDEVQHFRGIIAPCFVNAHCHIELSHMGGIVPEKTGLIPFLKKVVGGREEIPNYIKADARKAAVEQMMANGIIAVGDIANTTDTLDVRANSGLHIHSFIECLGFTPNRAENSFGYFSKILADFQEQKVDGKVLRQSIVPHAPYSVSKNLFRLIDNHQSESIISIHNQESAEENKFYQTKDGGVLDLLHTLGISTDNFQPSGKTSLQTYGEWLSGSHPLILVHNTFSSVEDVRYVHSRFPNAYWCLCPNANIYIEDRLPDIEMLLQENATICIGTDSLASNHQLCILSELSTIKRHFPEISWEALLSWSTYNGAKALQMEDVCGSISAGMQCGLMNITGIETDNPEVVRII